MTITLVLMAISTLLALGLALYLAYRETAIDLPPKASTHHYMAGHHGVAVHDAADLHYSRVRRSAGGASVGGGSDGPVLALRASKTDSAH